MPSVEVKRSKSGDHVDVEMGCATLRPGPLLRVDSWDLSKDISRSFTAYNDKLLHSSIEEAGLWSYGVVFCELWTLSEDHSHLIRPEPGWWVDPVYQRESCCCDTSEHCFMCLLTDKSREEYIEASSVMPGEGLPGALWSEVHEKKRFFHWRHHHPYHDLSSSHHSNSTMHSHATLDSFSRSRGANLVWRQLKSIASNPDQPYNPRLLALASLGLDWVCAAPFQGTETQGIVLFMARHDVDLHRLQSELNEHYILASANLAGSAYSLRRPWKNVVEERRSDLSSALRRVKNRILAIQTSGLHIQDVVENNSSSTVVSETSGPQKPHRYTHFWIANCYMLSSALHGRVKALLLKSRGGGMQPPPCMSWKQACLTFVGCFWTLLLITKANGATTAMLGSDYSIVMGPFGAFMTLLFGLTAAPASQPRNAMLGQIVSLTISILIGKVSYLELWMRQSLATALAVASMAKLGLTHPPAGAAALIYSSGEFGWGNMAFMLVGNLIALLCATVINNWSDKRQFPTYWGVPALRPETRP